MALFLQKRALHVADISSWICMHFKHHADRAFFTLYDYRVKGTGAWWTEIWRELLDLYLPVHSQLGFRDGKETDTWAYTCLPCMTEARYYLEVCLQSTRGLPPDTEIARKSFPFFKLPAEIRQSIYDMVFFLSKEGVYLNQDNADEVEYIREANKEVESMPSVYREAQIVEDNYLGKPFFEHWEDQSCGMLNFGYCRDIFAPLLVNRHLFQETQACFCNINTFVFQDPDQTPGLLSGLSKYRKAQTRRLAFVYNPFGDRGNATRAGKAFKMLATLPKLHHTRMETGQNDYGVSVTPPGVSRYPGITEWPEIVALISVKVYGSIIFENAHPKIEKALTEAVLVPRGDQDEDKE